MADANTENLSDKLDPYLETTPSAVTQNLDIDHSIPTGHEADYYNPSDFDNSTTGEAIQAPKGESLPQVFRDSLDHLVDIVPASSRSVARLLVCAALAECGFAGGSVIGAEMRHAIQQITQKPGNTQQIQNTGNPDINGDYVINTPQGPIKVILPKLVPEQPLPQPEIMNPPSPNIDNGNIPQTHEFSDLQNFVGDQPVEVPNNPT